MGGLPIHLKLRQAGLLVNYKRVERLYQEAKLQVRRRKRKKVPVAERQPLTRPKAANEVWSMDFVFDRTAEGRVIKCLTVVDDATHEAVIIDDLLWRVRTLRMILSMVTAQPIMPPQVLRQGVLRQGDGHLVVPPPCGIQGIEPSDRPSTNHSVKQVRLLKPWRYSRATTCMFAA